MIQDRRQAVRLACAFLGAVAAVPATAVVPPRLAADDGSPIRSFPAPDSKRLLALPGLLVVGPADADVTISEFFDYNCGFCRQASSGLDRMLMDERSLRLAFVHNPILSPASTRAAEAVAAVRELYGATLAYDLHRRVFAQPGRVTEASVLDLARAGGLDAGQIEAAMASSAVREAVQLQKRFATDGRLRYTPTFAIGDTAFVGWPGVPSMTRFLAAARRCGALQCNGAPAGGGR